MSCHLSIVWRELTSRLQCVVDFSVWPFGDADAADAAFLIVVMAHLLSALALIAFYVICLSSAAFVTVTLLKSIQGHFYQIKLHYNLLTMDLSFSSAYYWYY